MNFDARQPEIYKTNINVDLLSIPLKLFIYFFTFFLFFFPIHMHTHALSAGGEASLEWWVKVKDKGLL